MLLSASLLLFAAFHGGLHPSVKLMPSIQNTVASTTPAGEDKRAAAPPRTLDTPRAFPSFADRKEWEARRARIRQQVLVSCGLYPLPPKTPLKPKIFGRVERDGYTIEKVYFQTYPGFYLAGNLYRPGIQGVGSGEWGTEKIIACTLRRHSPLPGILITHGHWDDGRMADGPDGSIAGPRHYVCASWDAWRLLMTWWATTIRGRYPTIGRLRRIGEHWLWGVSLMGLQTWNSVRALDFLDSLPDVDKSRLAITGESGGGTQTMMLGAIDDRLAAVGPCVMVSHTMQGGCLCENAPGLRIDYSNMEIAAAAAPKPQIMVGATGRLDQNHDDDRRAGRASASTIWKRSPDNLKYVIFPFNHNINKTSRDAVYQFFGKVLLHDPNADRFTEPPYQREAVADLRVFPDNTPLPADAKTDDQLTQYLKELGQAQLEKAKPHDKRSLTAFQKTYRPAWERTLELNSPTLSRNINSTRESHADS